MLTYTEMLACLLYETYCRAVGGKAFNGDPLPRWTAFRADPTKRAQSEGWLRVAEKAIQVLPHENRPVP